MTAWNVSADKISVLANAVDVYRFRPDPGGEDRAVLRSRDVTEGDSIRVLGKTLERDCTALDLLRRTLLGLSLDDREVIARKKAKKKPFDGLRVFSRARRASSASADRRC